MRRVLMSMFFTAICFGLQAQKSLEIGINNGLCNYLGDLQPKTFTYEQSNYVFGVQGRYNFDGNVVGRFGFNYGKLEGYDRKSGVASLIARNLSFESPIFEISVIGELNLVRFGSNKAGKDYKYYKVAPYLFGGFNLFSFNPQANYNGKSYDLQPLGTEGQGIPNSGISKYRLTQIGLPFGAGLKYEFQPNIVLSYEFGWRKTFTDYLDDVSGNYYDVNEIAKYRGDIAAELSYRGDEVNPNATIPKKGSQRGDLENDDWYLMNVITVSYKIPAGKLKKLKNK